MNQLKYLSEYEKLAYFYGSYTRDEQIDPSTDSESLRRWEKIGGSRRKSRDRIGVLLSQFENTSTAHVKHLDNAYRAKRELILLAEGTIGGPPKSSSSRKEKPTHRVEIARWNNQLLQDCGALEVFAQNLQRTLHAFSGITFSHIDVDQLNELVQDLQQAMTLTYMLIVFNANKESPMFLRQLLRIGTSAPSYVLIAILDCASQMDVVPGFPIKRMLMLFYVWFEAVLGSFCDLEETKRSRREKFAVDKSLVTDEDDGILHCKTFGEYHDTNELDPQDPYFHQKQKFTQVRQQIHDKYKHIPTHEMTETPSVDDDASISPDTPDDEWALRCETMYQLFLPGMRDYITFFCKLVSISCGSALHARDKNTFYSRPPSGVDPSEFVPSDFGHGPHDGSDNQFWKWILREKTIVLDVTNLLLLLIYKHFRASHVMKAEYIAQFWLECNLPATLTKFMNKDIATYIQVSKNTSDLDDRKTGFYALDKTLEKQNIKAEDDDADYALLSTRTVTSILRILQKITKRKPNLIKNILCRGSSIVWLKRVVSLTIPVPRLYALKLVKSQAKYLGPQWVKKYTCAHMLTDIYLHVRPELHDDWLNYEDEDLNKPPSQESIERLVFGEMQAYHHKYYWESLNASSRVKQSYLVIQAKEELDAPSFQLDGGSITKYLNDLQLDPTSFCNQYEKWLDKEGLTADEDPASVPLPIPFS